MIEKYENMLTTYTTLKNMKLNDEELKRDLKEYLKDLKEKIYDFSSTYKFNAYEIISSQIKTNFYKVEKEDFKEFVRYALEFEFITIEEIIDLF